ncbi:hypothetical protein HNE_1656 [Hyphomonas neptunium ATCC 15444]|uniref:Uncharacterized protein n=2 Tax=Hyphomonas TaxID=85 RepID=Q0C1M9_HYPNA|nr:MULTISPECIES: hypothetical protein [Hyphomonas]ABI77424.1 hypothetical protein HNE_1656 [Hyphomonas neptunium ATCC 15444]KCZ92552.1 hypothetical protein HHI_11251 [Hyphomonas hirschiana VP5]
MIKGTSSYARARRPRPGSAAWTLARSLLLALIIACRCLPGMTRGKTRTRLLRFLQARTGRMEHIFRCLLICMRAAPHAPKPAPFTPRASACAPRPPRPRRLPARFSLNLSQLAKDLEKYGAPAPALANRKKRRSSPTQTPDRSQTPRGPTAAAPVADPLSLLDARLKAMRAILDDPHAHAIRFASLLKAAGIPMRRVKPVIPRAELWALLNHAAPPKARAAPGHFADTS